jgi:putative tricarboxylic transport membrane protein
MDLFTNLALGFGVAINPETLLYSFAGVFLGTAIGVLPGIGPTATIAMLLPVTFHAAPMDAIVMLAGIYFGAQYGGSTASILLNLPGTATAAVTCLDGYPMSQQGRGGVALFMTTIASFVGSVIGIIVLASFAPLLAQFALRFGPHEYFAIMVFGLVAAGILAQGSAVRGVIMVILGLIIGLVGADLYTAQYRFVFGIQSIADGINLVAIAMGLFGVAEVMANAGKIKDATVNASSITWRTLIPERDDVRRSWKPMLRGTAIGTGFGVLPGTGSVIASFVSYAVEKRVAKDPGRFGKGAIEGVAAPESANNSAAQTAFVPTLMLGVPGDTVMALVLGALLIHGVIPGPRLISDSPDLFWGLVVSFLFGNIMLVILNLPLIRIWLYILSIPYRILFPVTITLICIGVYSVSNSFFDIFLVLFFGLVGYGMIRLGFEPAPLLLGFILGPMMEQNLRRALILSRGELTTFFERPISGVVLAATLAVIVWSLWSGARIRQRSKQAETDTL